MTTTQTLTQLSIPKVNGGAFGDTFLLADGTYDHSSRESINKSGVIFKAKNLGKAIIKGAPIDLTGIEAEISGFELQYGSTEQTVCSIRGPKSRFLNNKCAFKNLTANRNDWFVMKAADDAVFQGNDVFGKTGMGKMLYIGPGTIVKNVKVLNNKLHDMTGGSGNGAECVGIGASPVMKEMFNIEFAGNEIYNVNTSDDELVSVKSSGNDIHDNIFRNNKGSPCFRHGRFNKFRNNKLEGTGLRIYGKGHEVTNNNFKRNPNKQLLQIVIGNGQYAEEEQNTTAGYTQVRDLLFDTNYIDMEDSTSLIGLCLGYGDYSLKPLNNKFTNNKILGSKGTLANTNDGASWTGNTVSNNILWPTGTALKGDMPGIIRNPNATLEERVAALEADMKTVKTTFGL